jgi:hypothetical protein
LALTLWLSRRVSSESQALTIGAVRAPAASPLTRSMRLAGDSTPFDDAVRLPRIHFQPPTRDPGAEA